MYEQEQNRRTRASGLIPLVAISLVVALFGAACSSSSDSSSTTTSTTAADSSSTTSTTSGGGGDATCPGGSECYDTSISPTSGGYGTDIAVSIVEGGCGDVASLVPPGGGEPIASTGAMDPGAGSLRGTITVPNEIPAPETYTVATNDGPQDKCSQSFEVTAS